MRGSPLPSSPIRGQTTAPIFVGSDDERARIRVMAHEPLNQGELFLRPGARNGKLNEGQSRYPVQPLRREELDLRVAKYGGVEREVTTAARAGCAWPLRAHARPLDEGRTASVVRVQEMGRRKSDHYDQCASGD